MLSPSEQLCVLMPVILQMVLYHNLVTQKVTQLLLSAMMGMSWLDLRFLPARMMEHGMRVLQSVNVS